ncbi:phosphate ABC transporter substrate-binding protein [Psychrosphaera ytuae]|uniref:Phosphate ABC transporter substrate-binding protein n=1 Tax=Psychrosphaera ytuae TaxID=2820710 RepID=A0A975DAW9_9GAMM|nr:phosphate ABC transporter substrate-binding protein [Psychrosphaera ytuae]QTH62936.1 phosphate ABC transporter substrate-binding protein [Psychrosphaera ytuae]
MKTLFVLFLLLITPISFAASVVVVNAENESKITSSDIKKLFLARKGAFNNGDPARLATLEKNNEIREDFNSNILNKSESQYSGYWAKMRFTGRATPPLEFSSSIEVREFVSKNKNAIGVMDAEDVDGSVRVVFEF